MTASTEACRADREILTDFCVFAGRESVGRSRGWEIRRRKCWKRAIENTGDARSENPIQTELVRLNNLYIVFIDVAFYRSRAARRGFQNREFFPITMANAYKGVRDRRVGNKNTRLAASIPQFLTIIWMFRIHETWTLISKTLIKHNLASNDNDVSTMNILTIKPSQCIH